MSSAFLSLSSSQLPPQRRLTHDEASSAMLPAARAPPPAPASSSRTVSAVPSFSGGFGAGSTSYTAGGGYSGMGLSRLPVGVSSSGANATNNDSIAMQKLARPVGPETGRNHSSQDAPEGRMLLFASRVYLACHLSPAACITSRRHLSSL